jgi:hypothetical protein
MFKKRLGFTLVGILVIIFFSLTGSLLIYLTGDSYVGGLINLIIYYSIILSNRARVNNIYCEWFSVEEWTFDIFDIAYVVFSEKYSKNNLADVVIQDPITKKYNVATGVGIISQKDYMELVKIKNREN